MSMILIIDDDREFVESTMLLLETEGYETSRAACGKTALAAVRKKRPDLILLDIMMSYDTEGFDVARRLSEDESTRGIPVIVLSGIRKAKRLPEKIQPDPDWLPAVAVLEKPVAPETLLRHVRSALGESERGAGN